MYCTIPSVPLYPRGTPSFLYSPVQNCLKKKYLSGESCYVALCVYQLMEAGAGGDVGKSRICNYLRVKEEPVSSECKVNGTRHCTSESTYRYIHQWEKVFKKKNNEALSLILLQFSS
jgi:hypothetical protein